MDKREHCYGNAVNYIEGKYRNIHKWLLTMKAKNAISLKNWCISKNILHCWIFSQMVWIDGWRSCFSLGEIVGISKKHMKKNGMHLCISTRNFMFYIFDVYEKSALIQAFHHTCSHKECLTKYWTAGSTMTMKELSTLRWPIIYIQDVAYEFRYFWFVRDLVM